MQRSPSAVLSPRITWTGRPARTIHTPASASGPYTADVNQSRCAESKAKEVGCGAFRTAVRTTNPGPTRAAATAAGTPRHATRTVTTLAIRVNRRPKLTLVAPGASPEEAAAVVAAIERFMRETAPPPALAPARTNPWARAARLEGVQRGIAAPTPWGDDFPWGR